MTVLVVGQNPAFTSSVSSTKNKTLYRLYRWMSKANVEHFSFMNAYEYPGSIKEQDVSAGLYEAHLHHKKIVALGNEASKALDKMGIKHLKMPHPSGLNRYLNDIEYEEKYIKLLRDYVEEN